MTGRDWTFSSTITHPDGTVVHVDMTVPESISQSWWRPTDGKSTRTEPVLECSELTQMGAVRSMSAYVATKQANAEMAPF